MGQHPASVGSRTSGGRDQVRATEKNLEVIQSDQGAA